MKIVEGYSLLQWTIFFMSYCILGWAFESAYTSLKTGRLLNRGFCHGPWLPIYGVGATLLVLLAWPVRAQLWLVFLVGMIGGSLLELGTGMAMFHIFKMKWWDYSEQPCNFRGYICLGASFTWGILAILIIRYIHPRVAAVSEDWTYMEFVVINTMLYTLFVEDVVFSILGALDLKRRLQKLAENSEEIERLRLSIQEARERLSEARQEMDANVEALRELRKTEGNAAAAKLVAEGTMQATRAAAAATVEKAKAVTEGPVETMKILAENSASTAKATLNRFSKEKQEKLRQEQERLEERLAYLEDGGSPGHGPMSWWSKSMIRNNPGFRAENRQGEALKRAALLRRRKKKDADTQ